MPKAMFTDKWTLVTGGSEGIGLAVAEKCFSLGANVCIISRSKEKLEKAVKQIEAHRLNSAQKVKFESVDVRDFGAVEALAQKMLQAGELPEFIIQCAGYARPGYIEDLSVEHFHQMMELNYFGIVHVTKAFVPMLMKRKSGYIVNTSSMAGYIGLFGYTGYCASKYAVNGFSAALKNELKPYNIHVSVLCPPNTKTPGLEAENKWKPKEVLATEEKATVVEPEFVADQLIKGMRRHKFMIIPTFDGNLAWYIGRVSPTLLDQFVKRPN